MRTICGTEGMHRGMKKIGIVVLACALFAGCSTKSLPQKLDEFVDNAELKSDSYTSADWEKSIAAYEELANQYSSTDESYTDAERQMAKRAMGRYYALLLKKGISEGAAYLKEFSKMLPDYLKGFTEGLKEDSGNLREQLEAAIDTTGLEQSLQELGRAFEGLFE